MTERLYLQGTEEQRRDFEDQMKKVRELGLVAIGSFGRQALFASQSWDVAPLPFYGKRREEDPLTPRDIDVLYPLGSVVTEYPHLGSHLVDTCLSDTIDTSSATPAIRGNNGEVFEVDQEVLTPVMRDLDGVTIQTFSIGTQVHLERLLDTFDASRRDTFTQDRPIKPHTYYEEMHKRLFAFADHVRHVAPKEFLDDAAYEPFTRAIASYDPQFRTPY